MTKTELIDAIHQHVPTASRAFLSQFATQELEEYFHAAESKAAKRARAGLIEVAVA